jgi:L-2,4-diaminobutyrate decarboxylase
VSAAACATPIGAFDPLAQIAEVCRRHEVWLHVDAAHGGALAFSDEHRHLLDGIEQADTVVCDAHKMMFMPALCAMLFYRNAGHRRAPFHQEAPYLFDPLVPELAEYDSGVANLECTKRAAAFGVWGVWSLFGPRIFADMVNVTIDLARQFHQLLSAEEDFETLHEPQCNIVAFRHLPREIREAAPKESDLFQLRLRRAVIMSGEFYLVQSRLDGRPVLRTTMMNPLTTVDDLRQLIECLRRTGRRILEGASKP